jgi:hypothetical protein
MARNIKPVNSLTRWGCNSSMRSLVLILLLVRIHYQIYFLLLCSNRLLVILLFIGRHLDVIQMILLLIQKIFRVLKPRLVWISLGTKILGDLRFSFRYFSCRMSRCCCSIIIRSIFYPLLHGFDLLFLLFINIIIYIFIIIFINY